jgi:hypothetical protein
MIVCAAVFGGSVCYGWSPYENVGVPSNKALGDSPQLPFDPNEYNFLIYNCHGGEESIGEAMEKIGVRSYTVCDAETPLTANILANHDILIVGWDGGGGNKTGLWTSALEEGITGRVILSGHDSDYHTVWGPEYAEKFFVQEIGYVLAGGGTGMIVCADVDNNFDWLPESWGIVMDEVGGGSDVSSFTQEGLDSGIYERLLPENMSRWGQSYHNTFREWGDGFRSFELGYDEEGIADRKVVTIATPVSPFGVSFNKDDGIDEFDCRGPGEEITYTLSWDNQSEVAFEDTVIVDQLPAGVYYPGADWQFDPNMVLIPPDPAYDPNTHTYTWDLGTVVPDETGIAEITVIVTEGSEPGMKLKNTAKVLSDGRIIGWAPHETLVCCWDTVDPNIIYIDKTAKGDNNGTSWADAYTDLQRALERARESVCDVGPYTILVAQGTYSPGDYVKNTFVLPAGASLYGGFRSGGSGFAERNPDRYETTLTGFIGLDANNHIRRNETVVMMGDNTLLDGFNITESSDYGIYGEGVDFAIENCLVENNEHYGVYGIDANMMMNWCICKNNGWTGVYHMGENYELIVENSQVVKNREYGIYNNKSVPMVKNTIIAENGYLDEMGYQGIRVELPSDTPVLYNNTIAYNANEGVSWVDDAGSGADPNVLDYPDIQNCIIWHNNGGGEQMAGYEFVRYSCVFDPNDAEGIDYTPDAYGNFSGNPGFAYQYSADPNVMLNVHLAYDSPCIDKGNPYLAYTGQADIDGEERIVGSYADIGADEVYSCDGYPSADDIRNAIDWTADGIVNFDEFGIFARSWLSADPNNPLCDPNNPGYVSDPNDPGFISEADKLRYYPGCDIDDDMDVDIADLALFAPEWLWRACWKESQLYRFDGMMMAMGGGEGMLMMEPATVSIASVSTMNVVPALEPDEFDAAERLRTIAEILWFIEQIEAEYADSTSLAELRKYLEDEAKKLVK